MIGIFDSGVGGLSVLKVLMEKAPYIDAVYFGDIKNAPYGIKTQDELKKLTIEGVKILLENGAKNILSACNSISAFMILDDLKELSDKPFRIMEMINPTVEEFKKYDNLAIFATPATIEAGVYQKGFEKHGLKIKTFAIPELAGAIDFGKSEEEVEKIVEQAVSMATGVAIETALLCCTHYPFVKDKFENAFENSPRQGLGEKVQIFDPAEVVAKETIKKFNLQAQVSDTCGFKKGKIRFLISKDSSVFRKMVEENFWGFEYTVEVL
ncbi:glutamate racemase [Patescibacteria group bacterium]